MLNQDTAIAYVLDRLMIAHDAIQCAVAINYDDVPCFDVWFDSTDVGQGQMTVWQLPDHSLYGEW